MLEAVLLDLDNTMIFFDEDAFYKRYFAKIIPYFADLIPPDQFMDRMARALKALSENPGRIPNSLYFLDIFCFRYRARQPMVWQRFLSFFEDAYDTIPVTVQTAPGLHAILDQLTRWQLKLVVASNPVFPKVVQEKRLAWAGLASDRFEMVTYMENMSFVKPSHGYYRQVCDAIGVSPYGCLMVGNDAVNDMAAGGAGLKTYLTTDAQQLGFPSEPMFDSPPIEPSPPPDFSGPLAGLPAIVSQLIHTGPSDGTGDRQESRS